MLVIGDGQSLLAIISKSFLEWRFYSPAVIGYVLVCTGRSLVVVGRTGEMT